MIKEELRQILLKYSEGKASASEVKLIESYYELLDNRPDPLEGLKENDTEVIFDNLKINITEGIASIEKQSPTANRKIHYLWRNSAAAVVLLMIIAGVFFMNSFNSKKDIAKSGLSQKTENRVTILPDGSIVYLKGDSKIFFPPSFENVSTREVILEGEAFFEVIHNPSQPFIVKAGNIETIVLGTSFNIQMNNKVNDVVTVTVKTGRVKILDHKHNSLGILTKNQQIVYSNSKFNITDQIPVENYLSWKKQDLILEEVTLSEACRILEDRFNTQIILNPEIPNENRFTATFNQNETIEKAVKIISAFNGIKYQYDSIKNVARIGYE